MVLRFSGDAAGTQAAAEFLDGSGIAPLQWEGGRAATAVLERPVGEGDIFSEATAAGAFVLPPLVWRRGETRINLIADDHTDVDGLISRHPGAGLVAKRPLSPRELAQEVQASNLFLPRLTRRQGEVIIAALEAGYYDIPRRVTTREAAAGLGIARSTFEEHLKRAEAQLVRALAPVVRLKLLNDGTDDAAVRSEAIQMYARFSEELGLYVEMTMRGDRVQRVNLADTPPAGIPAGDHPYLARILEHLSTGRDELRDIPVDLEVTPFERKVLELLRRIPSGEVVTYGDLAQRLGQPTAARAVGNAVARNPISIIIPCHRVVPATGGLGRYSQVGGTETKRRILEREGALGASTKEARASPALARVPSGDSSATKGRMGALRARPSPPRRA